MTQAKTELTKSDNPLQRFTPQQLSDATWEYCKRLCLAGNPFPLIAFQWPFLKITDPADAQYFAGTIHDESDPCLRLDSWQRDIIRAFFTPGVTEIYIKGNTKAGKGAAVAIATNLWFDVKTPCKIILTSQRYDHAVSVMYGEIATWHQKCVRPRGEAKKAGMGIDHDWYIAVANPVSGEGFSGQHGPNTLFILDEATSILDGRYEDAMKQARMLVALANPRTLSGWFRRGFPKHDPDESRIDNSDHGLRALFTAGGSTCLNAREKRLEKPIAPPGGITIGDVQFNPGDLIPDDLYQQVKPLIPSQIDYARWMGIMAHPDQNHRRVFGEGRFPEEDVELQVIVPSWLDRHVAAWRADLPITCFGLDVAGSLGGDETILAAGGEEGMTAIHAWREPNVMATVGRVCGIAQKQYGVTLSAGRNPICVDHDGLGHGVADRLREIGCWVIDHRGNASSTVDSHMFANTRAESYGMLGIRLNPDNLWGDKPWAIPNDSFLIDELCAPEKIYASDGLRFLLTPKTRGSHNANYVGDTITEKLGRSPDRGDAAAMLFAAVRELHLLDQIYASYTQPLVAAPFDPPPKSGEQPEPIETDLLKWLENRYGTGDNRPTVGIPAHDRLSRYLDD